MANPDSATFVTAAARFTSPYLSRKQQRCLLLLAKAAVFQQSLGTPSGVDYASTAAKWGNLAALVNASSVMGNLTQNQLLAAQIAAYAEHTTTSVAALNIATIGISGAKNIRQVLSLANPILEMPEDQLMRMEVYLDYGICGGFAI